MSLFTDFQQRLVTGLNRVSLKKCSDWATTYRIMGQPIPGPFTFKYHPWSKEPHDQENGTNVIMKAAQMGFTEVALNIAFFTNDILKQDVLYVLPNTKPDAADFSSARFDAALELSQHLRNLYSDVMNVGHKRAGAANMYIRGSGSRTGLKSIPVSKIILDEMAEMNQDNVPLVFERASGQDEEDVLIYMLSTPTILNKNIHEYFLNSTQQYFTFKCPSCSRFTELTYPDCLVITGTDEHDPNIVNSHYKCKLCQNKLPQETKPEWLVDAHWQPSVVNRIYKGWQIPQLYSCKVTPGTLAKKHFLAQRSPAHEQELWNSNLGLPHEVKGSRLTDTDLQDCIKLYENNCPVDDWFPTMGVDVGNKRIHVIISGNKFEDILGDVNSRCIKKLLYHGTVEDFETLDLFMDRFRIRSCVIDANPERRKADEFARRHQGRVNLCFYGNEVKGKTIIHNPEANTITVDRTSWLDMTLSRVKNKRILYPCNLSEEFKAHFKAVVRVMKLDKNGNEVARYENDNDDHFTHASNYDELAVPMGYNRTSNQDIVTKIL